MTSTYSNDSILSSEAVLRVVVGQNAGPQIFTCMASNGYGSTNETFQLNQNGKQVLFIAITCNCRNVISLGYTYGYWEVTHKSSFNHCWYCM